MISDRLVNDWLPKRPIGLLASVYQQHLKALEIIKNRWKKPLGYPLEVLVKSVRKNFTNCWKKIATCWNFLLTG